MKNELIIKQCEYYYQLNKLAGIMAYPIKMADSILEYTMGCVYIAAANITTNLVKVLTKINTKVKTDLQYPKIRPARAKMLRDILYKSDNAIYLASSISNIALIKASSAKLQPTQITGNEKLVMNSLHLSEPEYYDIENILESLDVIYTIEIDMNLDDLPNKYLLNEKSSFLPKGEFFKKLKINVIVDLLGSMMSLDNHGSYESANNVLNINISLNIKTLIDDIINKNKNHNLNYFNNHYQYVIHHELRHLVQSYIDWKTGNKKFNNKNQLCDIDASGNLIVDSNGNAIDPPLDQQKWKGYSPFSGATLQILKDSFTIDDFKGQEGERKIENLLKTFNLPKNTVINSMLLDRLKLISELMPESEEKNKKLLVLESIDELFQHVIGRSSRAQYLLSAIEYEPWLADSINNFDLFMYQTGRPYNKDSFEEFVGHKGISPIASAAKEELIDIFKLSKDTPINSKTISDLESQVENEEEKIKLNNFKRLYATENFGRTNALFGKLYLYDIDRWKKAVAILWNELNKKKPL